MIVVGSLALAATVLVGVSGSIAYWLAGMHTPMSDPTRLVEVVRDGRSFVPLSSSALVQRAEATAAENNGNVHL